MRLVAITQGLAHCAPDEVGRLADELVSLAIPQNPPILNPSTWWEKVQVLWWLYRNPYLSVADSALVQILRKWDRLPAHTRERAIHISTGRLCDASRKAIDTPHSGERIAVALSAQDLVSHELAPILVTLLTDPNSRVITCAERSLISLANAFAIEYGGEAASRLSLPDRTDLCNQVALAICKAPADSKAPFTAALALLDPSTIRRKSDLSNWFLRTDAAGQSALQACLRNRSNQLSRLRSWQWLHFASFSRVALDRLVHTPAISEHLPILERGHLAIRPARAVNVQAMASSSESVLPSVEALSQLSDSALCGLTLIAKSFRPSETYVQHLSFHVLAARNSIAKRRLLSIAAPTHLLDSAFESSESLARSAALRWSATGVGRLHVSNLRNATNLSRSPHGYVRELGKQERERLTTGDTNSTQSRMYTWQLLAQDRTSQIASLTATLHRGSAEEQMHALNLIRRHSLMPDFSDLLLELANSSLNGTATAKDPRVLATIISLLRRTKAALSTLLAASDNVEPRVRANAMESLLRTAPVTTSIVAGKAIERCEDISPRVRANSIRGLLTSHQEILEAKPLRIYEPHAVSALLAMLHDDRALHRLSGVWAAERVLCGSGQAHLGQAWSEVSVVLASVAKCDTECHVRRRAAAATKRISAELNSEPQRLEISGVPA